MNASRPHTESSLVGQLRATQGSISAEEVRRLPVIIKLAAEAVHTPVTGVVETKGGHATSRVICDLGDAHALSELRGWLCHRLHALELSSMPVEELTGVGASLERAQVLILRSPSRATASAVAAALNGTRVPPQIILLDAAHPVPEELGEAGLAVAFHLRGEGPTERLGQAVLDTLSIHVPLREACQRAVGKLPLRDALALVRLYMLREAFLRAGSKRGAARELGVTRAAVQQMLRDETLQAGASRQADGSAPTPSR